jgi:hypothetical protein
LSASPRPAAGRTGRPTRHSGRFRARLLPVGSDEPGGQKRPPRGASALIVVAATFGDARRTGDVVGLIG